MYFSLIKIFVSNQKTKEFCRFSVLVLGCRAKQKRGVGRISGKGQFRKEKNVSRPTFFTMKLIMKSSAVEKYPKTSIVSDL